MDRHKGVPPFPETRDYVNRILNLYGRIVHTFDESLTAGLADVEVASPVSGFQWRCWSFTLPR